VERGAFIDASSRYRTGLLYHYWQRPARNGERHTDI